MDENVRLRTLARGLAHAKVCTIYQDTDLNYQWIENAPDIWTSDDLGDCDDSKLFPNAVATRVVDAKLNALRTERTADLEISISANNRNRCFRLVIEPQTDEKGSVCGLVTVMIDVSDQKVRDAANVALLRELSHRSKNLLAIVQSLATQSARYARSLDEFLAGFRGRIQSLSSSQDVVTDARWRGARFHDLAASQLSPYTGDIGDAVVVDGGNPYLSPGAALHVGLALHELVTYSAAAGVVGGGEGNVELTANYRTDADEGDNLTIVWKEQREPGLATARGDEVASDFSNTMLTRVVPASLGGHATLLIHDDEVSYTLTVPPGQYER